MTAGMIAAAAIPSILSGVVLLVVTRQQSKTDKRAQERDEREELTLEALNAMFSITKELVDCVLNNKPPNGELKEAYEYKQEVKHKLEAYERKKAAES